MSNQFPRWATEERRGVLVDNGGVPLYVDDPKFIAGLSSIAPAVVFAPPRAPTAAELLAVERADMRCSRFQAKAALHAAGLLDDVETAMATADRFAQIAWADAIEFRRNSPTIKAMAAALELTDAQIDNLFRAAMQIEA